MDEMVEVLQTRKFPVEQMQSFWMRLGNPQYAFLPVGTNDEIERDHLGATRREVSGV